MGNENVVLEAKNVSRVYQGHGIETFAVRNVSLKVHAGEFVSLVGASGSGKSTLLGMLGLMEPTSEGEIYHFGTLVPPFTSRKINDFRRRLGFIFQNFCLLDEMSVYDNVMLGLKQSKNSKNEKKIMAMRYLERVGLSSRVKHYPYQLSGGQRQRVAVARALARSPNLLFADEPTGNLDSKSSESIVDLIVEAKESNTAVILVTHDTKAASRAEKTYTISDGKIFNEK